MQQITVEELKKRIDSGEDVHVLDVREPNEYEEYNINAKLYPLGKIMMMDLDELEPWKDEEIIVHCKAGSRSMQACMILEQAGFANVVNVVGGMNAWREKFGG